jgi:hypothetical protein
MSTLSKFKSFRARRNERMAHRVMIKREIENSNDVYRRDMMLYTNRLM